MLRAVAPQAGDTFIEIGPGPGALTRPLTAAAAHVLAYEIDRDLAASLRRAELPRFTLVEGDFLEVTPAQVAADLARAGAPSRVRVAGNLPYNVASPILFRLTDLHAAGLPLTDATVMLQREVADRLTAAPGTREYGVLSILIGLRARISRLLALPPGAFQPPPKVHSALVHLVFHAPDPQPRDLATFDRLVQAIFTRRRKTVANALLAFHGSTRLAPAQALAQAAIAPTRRPETLSIPELVRLADVFASISPSAVL